jgi:hypothetical protein
MGASDPGGARSRPRWGRRLRIAGHTTEPGPNTGVTPEQAATFAALVAETDQVTVAAGAWVSPRLRWTVRSKCWWTCSDRRPPCADASDAIPVAAEQWREICDVTSRKSNHVQVRR